MPSIFVGTAPDGIDKRNPVTVVESATVSRLLGHGSKQATTPGSEHCGFNGVDTTVVESWGAVVESTDCEFFPPPQLAINTAKVIPNGKLYLYAFGNNRRLPTVIARGVIP